MIFQEEWNSRISDFNRHGRLGYEAILQMLETAGSHHSDAAQDNVIAGSQAGFAWVLTEWRVKIIRQPDSKEHLRISTWIRGKAPAAMVHREFIVVDDQGNICILAEAALVLLDINRGRMTRITEDALAPYQPEDKTVFDDELPRLREPDTILFTHPMALRYSDIDFNGHVHNTRYMEFALDALPVHIRGQEDWKEIRIAYLKAVQENDEVITNYACQGDSHLISVTANGKACCVIELKQPIS